MNLQGTKRGSEFQPSLFYVLDGGFAGQLATYLPAGKVEAHPLWGAGALLTHPEAVQATHQDFLEQGAHIITTNTYQCSPDMFKRHLNLEKPRSEIGQLFDASVELARNAIRTVVHYSEGAVVAGSIGPYGAVLGDGSEYTGRYLDRMKSTELEKWHQDRIKHLIIAGVDIFAVETMPSVVEAQAVLRVISKYSQKCWVTFTCRNASETGRGERFDKVIKTLLNFLPYRYSIEAIGINCTNPEYITPLLELANKVNTGPKKLPYIVYPNSGEVWDEVQKCWTGDKKYDYILEHMSEWMDLGAQTIGGCCRVEPHFIRLIKNKMNEYKQTSLVYAAKIAKQRETGEYFRKSRFNPLANRAMSRFHILPGMPETSPTCLRRRIRLMAYENLYETDNSDSESDESDDSNDSSDFNDTDSSTDEEPEPR